MKDHAGRDVDATGEDTLTPRGLKHRQQPGPAASRPGRIGHRLVGGRALWAAILVLAGGSLPDAAAQGVARAGALGRRVDVALRSVPDASVSLSASVVDLAGGTTVFERNAHRALIPASNQKLLVMGAAVDLLGPSFAFRTIIGMRGPDLVIIGDGDPAIGDVRLSARSGELATAVFAQWASALKSSGHTMIDGDMLIDESIFERQMTHPTWDGHELQKWYASPVGALNLSDNCIAVTVWPADTRLPPSWSVQPPAPSIEVVNRAVSAPAGVPVIARDGAAFRYILSGRCGSRVTLEPVAVPDPGMFFADVFRGVLEGKGVVIRGRLRRERVRLDNGALPPDFAAVAEHRTPLSDVLGRIGKNSQNLFAECLAKRIGYEHMKRVASAGARGSWVSAAAAINAFLASARIDATGLIVADASGLSRANRVSAAQLVDLLVYLYHHRNRKLFMSSLAVAGQEGSLRDRLADTGARVIAKTGTLRGVSALSGYVIGPRGPRYAFSIIFNDFKGSAGPYREIQDRVCRILAGDAGSSSR